MKKIGVLSTLMLLGIGMMAQVQDPVIMKINGKEIKKSEFEYSFRKNNSDGVIDKKTVKEYVPLYVNFKLKVAAAEDEKYDTLASVKKDLAQYKEQMLLPTIVDSTYIEREARKTYDNTAARFAGSDILNASHILLLLRQDATAEQQQVVKNRIDSIHTVLASTPAESVEAKFAEIATAMSEDRGSAQQGGALPSFGKGQMVPEFEEAAYSLKAGELSSVVKTAYGYHIIYMKERHPFEPYEFHRNAILAFLDSRGVKQRSANAYVDSLARKEGVSRGEMIDRLYRDMLANDAEQRNLAQEYYDGTLMYEISNNQIWKNAQNDTVSIEAYYKAHKKDYVWSEPRFSGVVVRAKNDSVMLVASKAIKGVKDEALWAKAITTAANTDSVRNVRVEYGLFKKGDRAVIDKKFYKMQNKKVSGTNAYPVVDAFGKLLKKPRSYKDVRGQVATDYQNSLEKIWVESLRKKYEVVVYDDIVDTVTEM